MKKLFLILFVLFFVATIIPLNQAEAKKKKSKEVNCRTYFNTIEKVTKSECKRIKKLNKQSKSIDREYVNCANRFRKGLGNCIQSAKNQARKTGLPYTQELENWCINLWKVDEGTQQCWDTRNQKIRSVWFQFVDSL